MARMIIFDDGLGLLGPMTDLRASFEIRTGVNTTAERIAMTWPKSLTGYWVPERLKELVKERANAPVNQLPAEEELLCVNGRWGMPSAEVQAEVGEAVVEAGTGHVVIARLRRAEAEYFLGTGELHERTVKVPLEDRVLYRFPWDVIAIMKQTIPHDLANVQFGDGQAAEEVAAMTGGHPIEIDSSAKIYPGVVLDNEHGAIAIHEHAVIRPGAVLVGPCSIGVHSTVVDRAFIKANTVIGPWCKAAGEVGGTILQGFTNKAHDGHLGDCWVGEWVNFGAGTTNSNLLNTYGEVTMRMEPTGARHRTGLQFLGAIVGDHAKFAICTRIMTGTVVGTGAMIATSSPPPTTVPRFAWLTDEGSRVYKWEKFVEVARTVMGRRTLQLSAKYEVVLKGVYDAAMASAKV